MGRWVKYFAAEPQEGEMICKKCGKVVASVRAALLEEMGLNHVCLDCARQERTVVGARVKHGGGNSVMHIVHLEPDGRLSGVTRTGQRKFTQA